jgi:hypothetical protein
MEPEQIVARTSLSAISNVLMSPAVSRDISGLIGCKDINCKIL